MTDTILIFKTNINTPELIKKAGSILSAQSEIKKWNVDMDDCDKVLRIETSRYEVENVIGILKPHEIYCEELQ
jgi:hypothetical protein